MKMEINPKKDPYQKRNIIKRFSSITGKLEKIFEKFLFNHPSN